MEILVDVFLPVSLAIIMFGLGIGLTVDDFRRVAERKFAFFIGAGCQMLLLPIVAFAIVSAFGLSGELAAGFMLLAFCPGGATSNVLSKLARGDVALSVSLTALVSLLSILTVPICVAWAVGYYMGADAPDISITSLAIAVFLITTLPVILGMLVKARAPAFAQRLEPKMLILASVLFAIIIVAAVASNWSVFMENLNSLGPAAAMLVCLMLGFGVGIAKLTGLTWQESKTIAVECGIQNGTVGVTLAPIIVGVSTGLPALALPSAMYGVAMFVISIPVILLVRGRGHG